MEVYPREYVEENTPLLIVSGLGRPDDVTPAQSLKILFSGDSVSIRSDQPTVETQDADRLLRYLHSSERAGKSKSNESIGGFKLKNYDLPSKKALRMHSLSPDDDPLTQSQASLRPLHSTISPLSPASPLFPDGLMSFLWLAKHSRLLPAAFVSFYTLHADPGPAAQNDADLISDIQKIKSAFSTSGYKTRFVVVLLSERSILESPEVDERLTKIRRATGLDSKTSFFFIPPQSSPVELETFIRQLLSTLWPLCVEYYRDLSKHSRRKRGRSTIPQPTEPPTSGTSKTLSHQGWTVRYEFKLGVFAEFRQELDAAFRSYESGYEALMGAEVAESIASWSPRWNEARMLSDVFAIRMIRSLLLTKQTTAAARKWMIHRELIRDLVDRKGKGTTNYGWEAWLARWARVMAELVEAAEIPGMTVADLSTSTETNASFVLYSDPEKAIPIGDKLLPWERLHHPGYWIDLSTRHLLKRRELALKLPEEDRAPPGMSPASAIASRAYTNDTYLCPDPHNEYPLPGEEGINHQLLVIESIQAAITQYQKRGQLRVVERLHLELAREHHLNKDYAAALKVLKILWHNMSWRTEGWWDLVQQVNVDVVKAASLVGDGGALLSSCWELNSDVFAPTKGFAYNFHRCLDSLKDDAAKPAVILRAGEIISFLSATFAFKSGQGHVGDALPCQLVISSTAHYASEAVTLSEISILFDGGIRDVVLKHNGTSKDKTPSRTHSYNVDLEETSRTSLITSQEKQQLQGTADLTFLPGHTSVYEMNCPLREDGEGHAKTVTLSIAETKFDVDYIINLDENNSKAKWWSITSNAAISKRIGRENPHKIKVLPKPPKVVLGFDGVFTEYYTNEKVSISLKIVNEENEDVDISLRVRILGDPEQAPKVVWADDRSSGSGESEEEDEVPPFELGKLAKGKKATPIFGFEAPSEPVDYVVEVKAVYTLHSDTETVLIKTATLNVPVVQPFEVQYDFSPRIHQEKWPNFFTAPATTVSEAAEGKKQTGLKQRWCLTSTAVPTSSSDGLELCSMELQAVQIHGGANCLISKEERKEDDKSASLRETKFILDIQRSTLEDRRSTTLDLESKLTWRRKGASGDAATTTSTVPVPRLVTPSGEPRVLASTFKHPSGSSLGDSPDSVLFLDFTFENPTMHLLTFAIGMDSSDEFAFSGPKATSLQLLPLSRHSVRYILFPHAQSRGKWIQPQLRVVDRYFNKVLRVSATEGMKTDKKGGILVWVDTDEQS